MKPHVLFDMLQLITGLEKLLRLINAGSQIAEQLWRDRRCLDGVDLENLAKIVKVANLLLGELSHVCAAPCFYDDEALRFEPIERLADGRLTDSELCCKRLFG